MLSIQYILIQVSEGGPLLCYLDYKATYLLRFTSAKRACLLLNQLGLKKKPRLLTLKSRTIQ